MEELLNHIVRLVLDTAQQLIPYYQRSNLPTNKKPDNTLVTEADLLADEFIQQSLKRSFPNDIIISEELSPLYTINSKEEETSTRSIWIIDPLDGTTNFSLGLPFWGILITKLENLSPNLTVMYFPILNELYTARLGQGAFLNRRSLKISYDHHDQRTFFACCSRTFREYQVKIPYKVRILGSSAYSFCMLARNQAMIAFDASPRIWDIAGPWLLLPEAGGTIETLDGSKPFPLSSGLSFNQLAFPTIAAATPELVRRASQKIITKSDFSAINLNAK